MARNNLPLSKGPGSSVRGSRGRLCGPVAQDCGLESLSVGRPGTHLVVLLMKS